MLSFNPEFLEQKCIFSEKELVSIDHNANTLKIDRDEKSLFYKFYFDFIFASAKIEGNTYDRFEADRLLQTGMTANHKPAKDANELLNIRNAYDFIIDHKPEINKRTIKELHQILSQSLLPREAQGKVRSIQVFIGTSTYIPLGVPDQLETALDQILENYHSIGNPFNRAVYIHNNIAYLQYFQDCNKRLARMLQNLSLMQANKLPLAFLGADSIVFSEYKKTLVKYYETGSYEDYRRFFIGEYSKGLEFAR